MAWALQDDGCFSPDGLPFSPPADAFERLYNRRLKRKGAEFLADAIFDPFEGWPLSTRNFSDTPESVDDLVSSLEMFFNSLYQSVCQDAGNSQAELDLLASRLLHHAAALRAPITARERAIAHRLELDVSACLDRT